MIIPCIDLMGGKVVQLVQGRDKALEGGTPLEMLQRFAAFPQIQVIDLDAAMGKGSNDDLVELLATQGHRARRRRRAVTGARARVDRARRLPSDRWHGGFRSRAAQRDRRCRYARAPDHRTRLAAAVR